MRPGGPPGLLLTPDATVVLPLSLSRSIRHPVVANVADGHQEDTTRCAHTALSRRFLVSKRHASCPLDGMRDDPSGPRLSIVTATYVLVLKKLYSRNLSATREFRATRISLLFTCCSHDVIHKFLLIYLSSYMCVLYHISLLQ